MTAGDVSRLDARLVTLGLASGRDKAKELIVGGHVFVDGRRVVKPAAPVDGASDIVCDAPPERYVGRGGYKLEKAVELAGWSLQGAVAMDVGASTGGFTQCLLDRGAARVFAVDVGRGQLHEKLRANERVVCLEGTDIRDREALLSHVPDGSLDFCCVDVSFISLKAVLPAIRPYLRDGARMICLIKPQFEAGRGAVGKNGVVKDPSQHRRVLRELCGCFSEQGLQLKTLTHSPIRGGEGNIEYLSLLVYRQDVSEPSVAVDTDAVVAKAFAELC